MTKTAQKTRDVVGRELDAKARIKAGDIVIGKDVLELVSSAMYVDPITIYREYVQNCADSIDAARVSGILTPKDVGEVDITFDTASRTVRIRDYGAGVPWDDFVKRLTAVGGSSKRGSSARGFRGVGRLAGLGYCQELVFRSRTLGESRVSEVRWDCRKLRLALRNDADQLSISGLIASIVTAQQIEDEQSPPRFFEVELRGIVRTRGDRLMSPHAIADYLAQVAPVPFSPDFSFGAEITAALRPFVDLGEISLRVSGQPVYRPHRNEFAIGKGRFAKFLELEIIQVPAMEGGTAGLAWVLHHNYEGAIPNDALIKGMRFRSGNLQVGDYSLIEDSFSEGRFNAWAVGEVHVVDKNIKPNGRRDHFDQNAHFSNLVNHLAPIAREISLRCRQSSIERKLRRDYELGVSALTEQISIMRQATMGAAKRKKVEVSARQTIDRLSKVRARISQLTPSEKLSPTIDQLNRKLLSASGAPAATGDPLSKFPPKKRAMYEHFFELIYESAANRTAAKALIDRILMRIE